ncbi:MAG: Asp-tRNA(Asn)/Glu-tRNA(Gln) amidotransferase subunit GatB [Candidatus Krumholzibacteriia bacterium]
MTGAWETVIGLEVHAQLLTATKAFCGCAAAVGGAPNSRCCPVCLGLPGALPVLNRQAVELTLRVGLATGCRIAPVSVMARKHYFYPDLPKGYQISQYARPLCEEGALTVDGRRVRLKRIHLEEDAGKSVHGAGGTRVDLNRCGVPLAEIVTEPDLRSPAEAHATLRALRQLLVYLGVCDGNMEEGSLRCDANLSLRRPGSTALGVKTELKNLNSFRGVEAALRFEAERQAALLEAGERVRPETLLWDAAAREARPMRGKEDAEDYRYVPDPDLPPVRVDPAWLDAVRASLPELPAARAARFVALGLTPYDAGVLTADPALADTFEAVLGAGAPLAAATSWVSGELLRHANERGLAPADFPVPPAGLADLLKRVEAGELSNSAAKTVFARMVDEGGDAAAWIRRLDLGLVSDEDALAARVAAIVAANPAELARYRAGESKLFGWFVGQLMADSKGKADPRLASRLVRERLDAGADGD